MIDLKEALSQADRDVEASPDAWEPRGRRGSLLVSAGRFEEGASELRAALANNPNEASLYSNLGAALLGLGRDQEAKQVLERALELSPHLPQARSNLANCLIARGDREREAGDALAAAQSYRSALALNESFARGWERMSMALAELGAVSESTHAIKRAIALNPEEPAYYRHLGHLDAREITNAMVEHLQQIATHPKRYENIVDAELAFFYAYKSVDPRRAFAHLSRGAAARRKTETYDEAATLATFDEIAAAHTREDIARFRTHGFPSDLPIFIFGMPRSGTTLVEQILSSHPDVFGAGEINEFEIDANTIGYRTGQQLHTLGQHYVAVLRGMAPAAKRVTDKMLFNFLYAGIIAMALPNSRMIHVKRDPLDNALSIYEQLFAHGNVPWSYDLAEIGRYMREYQRLMEHWRTALPDGLMIEVQYEELVNDFDVQARRLVEFCGLTWDERCLEFHKTSRAVRTSSDAQVRRPLYANSIGRAEPYREFMQPFLDALKG